MELHRLQIIPQQLKNMSLLLIQVLRWLQQTLASLHSCSWRSRIGSSPNSPDTISISPSQFMCAPASSHSHRRRPNGSWTKRTWV